MGFIDRRGRKKPLIYGHSYGVESVIDALDGMAERNLQGLRVVAGAAQFGGDGFGFCRFSQVMMQDFQFLILFFPSIQPRES